MLFATNSRIPAVATDFFGDSPICENGLLCICTRGRTNVTSELELRAVVYNRATFSKGSCVVSRSVAVDQSLVPSDCRALCTAAGTADGFAAL